MTIKKAAKKILDQFYNVEYNYDTMRSWDMVSQHIKTVGATLRGGISFLFIS